MNIRMPTQEEIYTAFEQGEEAVVALFAVVGEQMEALAVQLAQQGAALKELQARLGKTSRNSGKPPSSDGYGKPPVKRTESLRQKGDKPNGGQLGHEGDTLKQSETPEVTKTHEAENCQECGASLKDVEVVGHEERQVFDIPAIRIEVTAHRAEIKICSSCGTENRGEFPEDVTAPVQYGNGVKTWAAYASTGSAQVSAINILFLWNAPPRYLRIYYMLRQAQHKSPGLGSRDTQGIRETVGMRTAVNGSREGAAA